MLDESDSLFVPAAFSGFDNTSKRRLRIPKEIVNQHGTLEAGKSLSVKGDGKSFLEPFFSVREYGCFERIDLVGIKHEGITYAVLVAGLKEGEEAALPFELPPLPGTYGDTLYACYSSKLESLVSPQYYGDKSQAAAGLAPLLDRCAKTGRFLHLCTVSTAKLLEAVQPASVSTDLFKFREDVRRILYSVVAPGGIYYEKERNEVILGFATTSALDCGFLSRHLILSINDFFPAVTLPDGVVRSCKSLSPEEIPSSVSFLFD